MMNQILFSNFRIHKYEKLLFQILIALTVISMVNISYGQTVNTDFNDRFENVAEQNDQVSDISELQEQLERLKENPVDINNASYEELQQSDILNSLQSYAIINHILRCGKLICKEELQSIDGFDLNTIQKILPYISISAPLYDLRLHHKILFSQAKQQLTFRWQRTIEKQNGYSEGASPGAKYLGDPNQFKMKYRCSAGKFFSTGLTAEKDAGEEFFNGNQKHGFDFYSFHLFLRPGKIIKVIALGDYQVQYSQGLIAWSGLAFGKSADVISIKKQGSGIKPYTSSNEFSYLRGFAISLSEKNFTLDSWLSLRKLDANINSSDTLSDFFEVSSIGSSGLHRTEYEIADRKIMTQKLAGSHLQWVHRNLKLGFTTQYSHYSNQIAKGTEAYQVYNFYGTNQFNYSGAYSWQLKNFNFFGEIAFDINNNSAMINGFIASLDRKISIAFVQRYYSASFNSVNANPLREGTKAQNEKGIYTGIQYLISKEMKLAVYFDKFKFPWLRYQVDAPSEGFEWLAQLTYTPSRTTEIYLRIKHQNKEADETLHIHSVDHQFENSKTNIRFNAHLKINSSVSFLGRVEWTSLQSTENDKESGTLFITEIKYQPMGKPVSITGSYQLFNTDSYDSRLYAYEQDFPGSASIPSSSFSGSRYYVLMRYHICRNMDLWLRYGHTLYDNKLLIGSAGEEISANHKSDIKVQVRLSF